MSLVSYVLIRNSAAEFFFFKQKTAYEMRISDWSSDVCSSDLGRTRRVSRTAPISFIWALPIVDLSDALNWPILSGWSKRICVTDCSSSTCFVKYQRRDRKSVV